MEILYLNKNKNGIYKIHMYRPSRLCIKSIMKGNDSMPIASLLSGLATLAGSGMAMVKCIRDDKRSRYPPEYLMYRDMMKMSRKGYPMNPMMMRMMMGQQMPMMNSDGFCMLPMQQPMIQQPIDPNQQLVVAIAQVIQQQQQQQQQQQLVNQIVQLLSNNNTNQLRRGYVNGWTPQPMLQPVVQQTVVNPNPFGNFQFQMPDFSALANKQLWDTPADGGAPQQSSQYLPMVVQPPMMMPPPQQPRVEVVQPRPQPTCQVNWCNPQEMIQHPQQYQQPIYVNRELTWDIPNMYSVDQSGFQSFMKTMEERSYYSDDGRYGNVW
jgi:hypothetical protein